MDLKEAVELAESRIPLVAATGTEEEGALLALLAFARLMAGHIDHVDVSPDDRLGRIDRTILSNEARKAGLLKD